MSDAALILRVKVVPGSSRDAVAGWLGDALKVKVAAAPERGKANQAVCRVLAGHLAIAESQVQVVGGQLTPNKRVAVRGLTLDQLVARLPEKQGGVGYGL